MSEQVGYGNLGAFRQLFRRETGLSPTEYRRHLARRMSVEPALPARQLTRGVSGLLSTDSAISSRLGEPDAGLCCAHSKKSRDRAPSPLRTASAGDLAPSSQGADDAEYSSDVRLGEVTGERSGLARGLSTRPRIRNALSQGQKQTMSENATTPDRSGLLHLRPTGNEIGAIVCALLPFWITAGYRMTTTVNGVSHPSGFNIAGLVFGGIALVLLFLTARRLKSRSLPGPPALHIAIIAATAGLTAYQMWHANEIY